MAILPIEKMQRVWHKMARTDSPLSFSFDTGQFKKVADLFQSGEYYYYIFNLTNGQIEFVSDNVAAVLGIAREDFSAQYVFDNTHPEDLPYFMDFETTAVDFFYNFSPERLKKYKIRFDYRIKKPDNSYIRILHQVITIQTSEQGGAVRMFGIHTDITYLKQSGKPMLSFIGLEGEPSFINVTPALVHKSPKHVLSTRERKILYMLANGMKNKEIAEALFISRYTVDTHRRNIMNKTQTVTMLELIKKAITEGWI